MIPIYRAKEIDSDEWVEGYFQYERPRYRNDGTINGKMIEDKKYLIHTESGIEYP